MFPKPRFLQTCESTHQNSFFNANPPTPDILRTSTEEVMSKNEEGTKVSSKVIAVLNKEHAWCPAYSKGEIMPTGQAFTCKGNNYIDNAGDLVLENRVGHGWHEVIAAGDFDIFLEETVTVITKTVTRKPATIKGKYIVPVVEGIAAG